MKYSVVTSFSNAGFEKYGRKFIETFNKYWSKDIDLHIYHEGMDDKLFVGHRAYDLYTVPECSLFSRKYRNDPLVNGRVVDAPFRWKKKCVNDKYNFRYDAYKFSKKVFAIYDAARKIGGGKLFWVDADIVTFDNIDTQFLEDLLRDDYDTCYLGRIGSGHSECGFVGYNLDKALARVFIGYFANMYSNDEVFALNEWHDSYVYDKVREYFKANLHDYCIPSTERGHVFINSVLGTVMDHLKGDRKDTGKSSLTELKAEHQHDYWRQA